MPTKQTDTQTPGGKGGSAPQKTSTGSGSRPGTKGAYPIKSTAPSSPQKLRG